MVSLHGINLEIRAGACIALVGESGSGKSTLAKCITRIEKPSAGEVRFEGKDIWTLDKGELMSFYGQVQLIYQDSATSLNPRFTSEEIVAEPLIIEGKLGIPERHNQVLAQMERVELSREYLGRHPIELSGGQRQRLAIARALIVKPRLLIFDEALSGLDLLVQTKIVDMLRALRSREPLTYLFITHDLALAREIAEDVVVLYEGEIVERVPAADLFTHPRHPYTRQLVDSAQLLEFSGTNARG